MRYTANLFGATTLLFPSDALGTVVTTSAAGSASTGATTTYTSTTAVDSAYNPATAPTDPLTAGCLICTADGFYANVESFTAGAGGAIVVRRWLHRDQEKIGRVPADLGVFTVYTKPLPAGKPKKTFMGRVRSIQLMELQGLECLTGNNYLQLTDAAGNVLLPNGAAKGYEFTTAVAQRYQYGLDGQFIPGIIGYKLSHATDLTVQATFDVGSWDRA